MKSTPKWLLLPPAVAALLILGTLSMQGGSANPVPRPSPGVAPEAGPVSGPAASAAEPAPVRRDPPAPPRSPDLMQLASALVGVLLLGAGGLLLLRRLRGGVRAPRGATLLALRQTLRLSAKQAIHALEFDDRILLVGEHDRGLCLLDSGRLPERTTDEAAVAARAAGPVDAIVGDDDDGAVPKDLVIPRPSPRPAPRLPTAPAKTKVPSGLGDFRRLLQQAGRA